MIKITNSDDLCCARAIVTMKAYVDGTYKQYDNLRRGRNIQERLAKQLHREANVPEGACGFEELKNFTSTSDQKGGKLSWLIMFPVPVFFKATWMSIR